MIVFGFPLIDIFIDNPNYKSFAELKKQAKNNQFQVYEYNSFGPEIIWDYGKPIPILVKNDSLFLPEENEFGLLLNVTDTISTEEFSGYSIQKIEQYDLNQVHPEKSGYKDRLMRDFYILKKKK